jgi:hypothetical protein
MMKGLRLLLQCNILRYGSSRTRVVLKAADGIEAQRAGPERAERLFHAWLAYQRLKRNETDAEIEGN